MSAFSALGRRLKFARDRCRERTRALKDADGDRYFFFAFFLALAFFSVFAGVLAFFPLPNAAAQFSLNFLVVPECRTVMGAPQGIVGDEIGLES